MFVTAQGSPQSRFQRACDSGDVSRAERAAKELGYVSLPNALRLVCLYAATDDPKFDAAAVKFLGRLIQERRGNTLGSVTLAAASLAELRGHRHEAALQTLSRLL
jgi:hypothetical protein